MSGELTDLAELAKRIRIHVLRMTNRGGSSHVGAAFSMTDIVAVLYGAVMNVNPKRPDDPARISESEGLSSHHPLPSQRAHAASTFQRATIE